MLQPHIQLDETILAHCALLPGDPARLDRIAQGNCILFRASPIKAKSS